jgi:hypothetical protein
MITDILDDSPLSGYLAKIELLFIEYNPVIGLWSLNKDIKKLLKTILISMHSRTDSTSSIEVIKMTARIHFPSNSFRICHFGLPGNLQLFLLNRLEFDFYPLITLHDL